MFRRLASSLPKDPVYPHDLKSLGYFINDQDEIRNIEDPKSYFKFFLTKNDRHNCLQREAMNDAIRNIIYNRLEDLGLDKIRLPLGARVNEPNVPIFVSADIKSKKRVVILFNESTQDLGVFAHRIIGGKGGISQGSVIDFVKYCQSQSTSSDGNDAPGIIIANMGQLRWWRRGKQAVTQTSWYVLPQSSAVEQPYRFDPVKNTIPGNRTAYEHVEYIFNEVVSNMVDPKAEVNIVGVSESANQVQTFLEKPENFAIWNERVTALAVVATYYLAHEIKSPGFAKWFVNHGRAYIVSHKPASTYLASHLGRKRVPAYGCPVFSLGEPYYAETMLPRGHRIILDWFSTVGKQPDYKNPVFELFDFGTEEDIEDSGDEEDLPWNAEEKLNTLSLEELD